MKGISRSFWTLVGLSALAGIAVLVITLRAAVVELSCWWAPLGGLDHQLGACGDSTWALGHRTWIGALALVVLLVACVLAAAFDIVRRGIRTRRTWAALARCKVPAPPRVLDAAARAGLAVPTVLLGDQPYCFCRGLFRPEVVVSTGMVEALGLEELVAVFAHEGAHATRRDPLRAMLAHGAAAGLFFLPVLRDLAKGERVSAELGADAVAVDLVGRRPLVRALKLALGAPHPVLGSVAEMASLDALDMRIEALVSPRPPRIKLRRRSVMLSLASLALLGAVVALGVISVPPTVVVPMQQSGSAHAGVPTVVVPGKVTVLPYPRPASRSTGD